MSKGLNLLKRTAELLEKREKLKRLKVQRELRQLQKPSPDHPIESLLYHGPPQYPSNQGMWEEDTAAPYMNDKQQSQVLQNDLISTPQEQNRPYRKPMYDLADKVKDGGHAILPRVNDRQPSRDLRRGQASGIPAPIKPPTRANRPSYMRLLSWMGKIARPRLKPGYRRIEWTCVSSYTC